MKNILVFVNSFNYGGITSLIKDIYRNIDKTKYRMSFVRPDWNHNKFDDEIIGNGDRVFYIQSAALSKIPILNYYIFQKQMVKQIYQAVDKSIKYDVAYIHANARYAIPAAERLGIPNIIFHSHEAISDFKGNEEKSLITRMIWKKRQGMYNRLTTYKVGDSMQACTAKFGKKAVSESSVVIISPPINLERFSPDRYNENDLPDGISINRTEFNMIHVGRLCEVKNQGFMIEILAEMNRKSASHLYIVGEGDTEKEKLLIKAEKYGVSSRVTFLPGNTSPAIYKYMNCSLLPSFSEAFGMVAVESQLMGVPCFASTNVPDDVNVGMCEFVDLDLGAEKWSDIILNYDYDNCSLNTDLVNKFKIESIVERLENMFEGKI